MIKKYSHYMLLALGLFSISTAAPILCEIQLNSFSISFWRLLLASFIFAGLSPDRNQYFSQLKNNFKPLFAASLLMALHFLLWITAFSYTDMSSNVIIIVFQPIFAIFIGWFSFSEPFKLKKIVSILLAGFGLLIIVGDDFKMSENHVFGDFLGMLGTLAITLFYAFTKKLKDRMTFLNYISAAFFLASLWCLLAILIFDKPLLITNQRDYLFMGLLMIFPTLTGHSLLNYCTRFFTLFALNISIIAEPLLAIFIAWLFKGDFITIYEGLGGGLLVCALMLGIRDTYPEITG